MTIWAICPLCDFRASIDDFETELTNHIVEKHNKRRIAKRLAQEARATTTEAEIKKS